MKNRTKKVHVQKRQWLRPQRSPGPQSTIHHRCVSRLYGEQEYRCADGTKKKKKAKPHFSVDCDLDFRDCSNYVSFDLSCYELKHFARNRQVLRKIKAAVAELEMALNDAEDMARKHMGSK